jgi:SulP family sulfate permease
MVISRLKHFFNPFDNRFEDLRKGNVVVNVVRDFTAGLVVALVAIPLAMGLAMASGLRPEQGIVCGAVACLVGAFFGGSKYSVYGPTAAFIPTIAAIMAKHDHTYLVTCSLLAGGVLAIMSLTGAGKIVKLVPHSIVVGFTIGIAVSIALSQGGEIFGLHASSGHGALEKAHMITTHYGTLEIWAVVLAIGTVILMRIILQISAFIPGPLIALGLGIGLTQTLLAEEGLILVRDKFGTIPAQSLKLTLPALAPLRDDPGGVGYAVVAIVFVAAIESLLCARLADRLAKNKGTQFDADKELWGQAHVMIWAPLLNGFPSTGALARTATNIKLGALSPLALIFKAVLKMLLAFYLASYLELVPMACVGGILLYVATNMVKREEIHEVMEMGTAHVWLMFYTAVAVIAMDFLRGVLSALVIYGVWQIVVHMRTQAKPSHTLAIYEEESAAHRHEEHAPARAVIARSPRQDAEGLVTGRRTWLANIRRPGSIARTAFVHGQANVAGRVVLGDHVHIAAGASVRADEGTPFYIGSSSNIQDGVVIHALKDKHVLVDGQPWAVYIGESVSIAHDALIHGPCHIGDHTFVGFKAVVHDAVVGDGSFVGIGAIVVGVEIPPGRYVAPGAIIDTPEKAAHLPPAGETHRHFNEDVVEVNRGLAAAYRENMLHRLPRDVRDARHGREGHAFDLHEHDGWAPPEPLGDRF